MLENTIQINVTTGANIPVRPHHVGQPLLSLTTHDENIRRNKSHFTSHIVMLSCCRNQRSRDMGKHANGAISIDRKPTSNSIMSLYHIANKSYHIFNYPKTKQKRKAKYSTKQYFLLQL